MSRNWIDRFRLEIDRKTNVASNRTPDESRQIRISSIYKEKGSSKFRGVVKVKNREVYEAHVYDNGYTSEKGRSVYLGRFDNEEDAARAYDLVSLKFWGTSGQTNFLASNYEKDMEMMAGMSDHEYLAAIRRSSSCFSKGKSIYRGVTREPNAKRWQARKGKGNGGFLGTFKTEEEAAIAFDIATIKLKGHQAVTNFDISNYDVDSIIRSDSLPIGNAALKRLKEAELAGRVPEVGGGPGGAGDHQKKPGTAARKLKKGAIPPQLPSRVGNHPNSEKQDGSQKETTRDHDDHQNTPMYGLNHSSSSAFKLFREEKAGVSSYQMQEANGGASSGSWWPYQIKAGGSGFQHASSSGFKPYSQNQS